MKTDYKNWMPKGMVLGSACTAALFLLFIKKVLTPTLRNSLCYKYT